METIYLILVIVLFALAISDLVVGVSNDAVNFLNAAVGSKVATFRVIMIVAGLGILSGAFFSSGMMEVARKGIFHPQMFYFSEIMYIFLAVMVADVVMLDVFNTFGLPTSTTVSIVFDLLGASVGMASIKLMGPEKELLPFKQYLYDNHLISGINESLNIGDFINSSKALAIITGILVSVAIAFTVGAIIQYIVRVVFSFDYKKRIKKFGALWGGFAITFITYFIFVKGIKGASFVTEETVNWINGHTGLIMLYSFLGWVVILQALYWLFKVDVLKIIVLVGTFSLAMAFAGNDLVNFIGVPIAGYNAYEVWIAHPASDPNLTMMTELGGKVAIPSYFLLVAGLIMVITLFTSRKAKSVIKTSIDLSRQSEGDERFKSNKLSKIIVRSSIAAAEGMKKMLPKSVTKAIEVQFRPIRYETSGGESAPAFDLIRASVILTVSSALIAFGTSLKLPLSTTYVTFMVAMGASLADKAWGRESAVYRISGVFTVIGGWFLTAMVAFTIAFSMAYLFYYGKFVAVFVMVGVAIYLFIYTKKVHEKREEESDQQKKAILDLNSSNVTEKVITAITTYTEAIITELDNTLQGLEEENLKKIKKSKKKIDKITADTKYLKNHINDLVEKIREESLETSYYVVTILDYLREMLHSISFINDPIREHVDNNHKPLLKQQIKELYHLKDLLHSMYKIMIRHIEKRDFSNQEGVFKIEEEYLKQIEHYKKQQVKRIKNGLVGTKNTILYLNILNELKNLSLHSVNLYKAQRDFIASKNGG